MKILITGAKGQLGRALIGLKPCDFEIYAMDRNNFDMLDIPSCLKKINKINPDWIINCAAYTDVGLAELNEEIVMKVNYLAPAAFAEEIKKMGGKFLQISTDYVFDGNKNPKAPYSSNDKRSPLGLYGLSKAKAEESIERTFSNNYQGIILRTSWLIGPVGKNFLLTILNLHLKNKEIKVVDDQIGSPTSTISLSKIIWEIIKLKNSKLIFKKNKNRILHWQENGETNWYEIASNINSIGKKIGLIKRNVEIVPIKSSQYPSKAQRPPYSILDCSLTKTLLKYEGIHWKIALKEILEQIQLDDYNKYSSKSKF